MDCNELTPYHWYQRYFEEKPEMWPCLERRITNVIHLIERYVIPGEEAPSWPIPAPEAPPVPDNRILFHA